MWRPWEEKPAKVQQEKEIRKRVTIGEIERNFVIASYNHCHGKEWSKVLKHVQQNILSAGLPSHVIDMYLNQPEERLTGRMRRIINQELQTVNSAKQIQGQSSNAVQSSSIQGSSSGLLLESRIKYAKQQTPGQRRQDALKAKLDLELVASSESDDSASSTEKKHSTKRKRKERATDSAHRAHKKMCEKALETMDSVKCLLSKVDSILEKSNT